VYGPARACLLASLVQLLVDPFCGTIAGFQHLIQKEWLKYVPLSLLRIGHDRSDRERDRHRHVCVYVVCRYTDGHLIVVVVYVCAWVCGCVCLCMCVCVRGCVCGSGISVGFPFTRASAQLAPNTGAAPADNANGTDDPTFFLFLDAVGVSRSLSLTHTHTYTHTHTHTYIHTHTHTHTHTHSLSLSLASWWGVC
jgi:hypothetical protein